MIGTTDSTCTCTGCCASDVMFTIRCPRSTGLSTGLWIGDTTTVDACRRVIDADLRGEMPDRSDVAMVSAFFN